MVSEIPASLLQEAVILGGEPAWPKVTSLAAVDDLARRRIAVIGVEVWYAEGKTPRVDAISTYEIARGPDWGAYVNKNAEAARSFIERIPSRPDALFNFTWLGPDDQLPDDI